MSSVLLDTNLLLLLVVGLYDENLIENHKRTSNFTKEDFALLKESLANCQVIWVTSHCLAEVSNLLKQSHANKSNKLMAFLKEIVSQFKESHIEKTIVFKQECFSRLGVADSAITVKAKRVDCVFTVDFDLYNEISRAGCKVINFNHLRMENMLS
ncbi:hypothetical protein QUF76_03375 [Desulfobacterales bacterium HSG16]|nr:hypothetical protein [Desulfobacterales bacterium HSG16]